MNNYTDSLRLMKALLIVASLQQKTDLKALQLIKKFSKSIEWEPRSELMIEDHVWDHAVLKKKYEPKLIFCHPDILIAHPVTSLYYRGLCGLSIKAAKDYFGSVENIELGTGNAKIKVEKALKMARVQLASLALSRSYNPLISGFLEYLNFNRGTGMFTENDQTSFSSNHVGRTPSS